MSAREGTAGLRSPVRARIPVLLYHSVTDDPPGWIAPLTVRPAEFEAQLDAVVDSGRTPLTATELADALAGRRDFPERPVVITVDDGFADLATFIAPALADRGLTATAYLTTGAIGGPGGCLLPPAPMMALDQVEEIAALGVEIGAHTVTHAQLDTLPRAAVRRELADPKALLEDLIGQPVPAFAYPHGYSSPAVRQLVREAGYTSATAVRDALSSTKDEPYRIARIMLRNDDTTADLAAWMEGDGAQVAPFPEPPRTLAWRWYRRGRRMVRGNRFSG